MRSLILLAILTLAGCSAQDALVDEAHEAVKEQLVDPESAKFKDSPSYTFPKLGLICGEVNSKNGFGGYSGFKMYAYQRDQGAVIAESDWYLYEPLHNRCLEAIRAGTKAIQDRANASKP